MRATSVLGGMSACPCPGTQVLRSHEPSLGKQAWMSVRGRPSGTMPPAPLSPGGLTVVEEP